MTPCVFILGISSDIGRELGLRYARAGWRVVGTYRTSHYKEGLPDDWTLFPCDVLNQKQIDQIVVQCLKMRIQWETWISAIGVLDPIGSFFQASFAHWEQSIQTNCLAPLRVLHAMHPYRRRNNINSVVFFAGAGTNGPAANYSAYCASKIFLIKMTELLDDENLDLNVFIIGPGIVKTRIHQQTIAAGSRAGLNFEKVNSFLADETRGVSHDEIFDCLMWCHEAGKEAVGGRNISLVGDAWRTSGLALKDKLLSNRQIYKLRRFGNDWKQ
jgi:NAD(P)-dependent dehydrogenase (short-subunit alcohol dehydrogenase family)